MSTNKKGTPQKIISRTKNRQRSPAQSSRTTSIVTKRRPSKMSFMEVARKRNQKAKQKEQEEMTKEMSFIENQTYNYSCAQTLHNSILNPKKGFICQALALKLSKYSNIKVSPQNIIGEVRKVCDVCLLTDFELTLWVEISIRFFNFMSTESQEKRMALNNNQGQKYFDSDKKLPSNIYHKAKTNVLQDKHSTHTTDFFSKGPSLEKASTVVQRSGGLAHDQSMQIQDHLEVENQQGKKNSFNKNLRSASPSKQQLQEDQIMPKAQMFENDQGQENMTKLLNDLSTFQLADLSLAIFCIAMLIKGTIYGKIYEPLTQHQVKKFNEQSNVQVTTVWSSILQQIKLKHFENIEYYFLLFKFLPPIRPGSENLRMDIRKFVIQRANDIKSINKTQNKVWKYCMNGKKNTKNKRQVDYSQQVDDILSLVQDYTTKKKEKIKKIAKDNKNSPVKHGSSFSKLSRAYQNQNEKIPQQINQAKPESTQPELGPWIFLSQHRYMAKMLSQQENQTEIIAQSYLKYIDQQEPKDQFNRDSSSNLNGLINKSFINSFSLSLRSSLPFYQKDIDGSSVSISRNKINSKEQKAASDHQQELNLKKGASYFSQGKFSNLTSYLLDNSNMGDRLNKNPAPLKNTPDKKFKLTQEQQSQLSLSSLQGSQNLASKFFQPVQNFSQNFIMPRMKTLQSVKKSNQGNQDSFVKLPKQQPWYSNVPSDFMDDSNVMQCLPPKIKSEKSNSLVIQAQTSFEKNHNVNDINADANEFQIPQNAPDLLQTHQQKSNSHLGTSNRMATLQSKDSSFLMPSKILNSSKQSFDVVPDIQQNIQKPNISIVSEFSPQRKEIQKMNVNGQLLRPPTKGGLQDLNSLTINKKVSAVQKNQSFQDYGDSIENAFKNEVLRNSKEFKDFDLKSSNSQTSFLPNNPAFKALNPMIQSKMSKQKSVMLNIAPEFNGSILQDNASNSQRDSQQNSPNFGAVKKHLEEKKL